MHHEIPLAIYWILGFIIGALIGLGILMFIHYRRKSKLPSLRDLIVEEYGEDFAENIYDSLNEGVAVGDFETTVKYLDMITDVKLKHKWK